jgi:hypothetical protein
LLLVPQVCALDWQIASRLAEWADVATYDAPGVGDEPLAGQINRAAIAERGLEELDRVGWERCVLAADEFGVPTALLLARMRPEAVAGLALGHACLSHDVEGDRPPVNGAVLELFVEIAQTEHRTWARHVTQVTQGAYDDELAERYLQRVPPGIAARLGRAMQESARRCERRSTNALPAECRCCSPGMTGASCLLLRGSRRHRCVSRSTHRCHI